MAEMFDDRSEKKNVIFMRSRGTVETILATKDSGQVKAFCFTPSMLTQPQKTEAYVYPVC